MRARYLSLLLRAALFVAIVASAALFADYEQAGGPGFCGVVSGCAEVSASRYAQPFGVPLPALGLGGFLGLYALAAWASTRRHLQWLAAFCVAAALAAVGLIAIMLFELRTVCPWCLGSDLGAIVAAFAAVALARAEPPAERAGRRILWSFGGIAAVAVTLLFARGPRYQPPPPDVAALRVPGRVTMVVFTDFQCPFCRLLHPVVEEIASQHPAAVAVRLVMVPLAGHPGAELGARAYLCTDAAHRTSLAHALYGLAFEELIYQTVLHAAKDAGVDVAAYASRLSQPSEQERLLAELDRLVLERARQAVVEAGGDPHGLEACVVSPATRAELERHQAIFARTGRTGLPAIYVENFLVEGADEPQLRAAVAAALVGGQGRDVRPMFALLGALLLGLGAISLVRGRRSG